MMARDKQVSFTAMEDGSREDYLLLRKLEKPFLRGTAERLLRELAVQGQESLTGYRINRLQHALQTATRARRDDAEIDWVVAALLHDIGDSLSPQNHDRFAAEILRPFVREEVSWVVGHHGVFQMIYYAQYYGWDRQKREKYAGNPYYQSCVDFCARWDQSSFDPDYPMDSLDSFRDEVFEVFNRKAFDAEVTRPGLVLGLPEPND
jgi:predicted HD phosphohydrolase